VLQLFRRECAACGQQQQQLVRARGRLRRAALPTVAAHPEKTRPTQV
jgi:hypothetical protein